MLNLPKDFYIENEKRYRQAVKGKEPDKISVYIWPSPVFFQWYTGTPAAEYYGDWRKMLRAQLETRERFYNLPFIKPGFSFEEVSALGCSISLPDSKYATYRVEPCIKSSYDAKRLKVPKPLKDGLMPKTIEYLDRFRDSVGEDVEISITGGCMGPFDNASLLMGVENLYISLYDNPKMVHNILEIVTDTCIKWLKFKEERLCSKEEKVLIGEDYAAYLPPDMFSEFVVPYNTRIFKAFPDSIKRWHSDGDFHYDTLSRVSELGLDDFVGFSPKLDISKVRKIVGPEICLSGNVDPINSLTFGNTEKVKEDSEKCIRQAKNNNRFVLAAGGGLGADINPENIDAMIKVALSL